MFFLIAMNGAECDIHFFLKKEDQIAYFHEKKKKCLPLFVEVDILGLSEIFCFVLHSCSIMIDQKNQYSTIIMKYFIVWVVVCVIPACCFFLDECLNEETSGGIFGKKKKWMNRLFLFFHQHTSCLLRLRCQLDRQDCGSFYCSCLSQFLELIHQDCSGLLRN